jgi:hypothetical protein
MLSIKRGKSKLMLKAMKKMSLNALLAGLLLISALEIGCSDDAGSGTNQTETVATPTATPPEGVYDDTLLVELETATNDAKIYYTTDGTPPYSSETKILYTGGVTVPIPTTLKAFARKEGWDDSEVLTATYARSAILFKDNIPVDLSFATGANEFAKAFDFIRNNATNGISYTIKLYDDIDSNQITLNAAAVHNATGVNIILEGYGVERTINLASSGTTLFTIGYITGSISPTLTLGSNITLKGRTDNTKPVIDVVKGTLIMKEGSKVTGNTNTITPGTTNAAGGIYINTGCTFIMEGGSIIGNSCPNGDSGGIAINENAIGIIRGGTIKDNTVEYDCDVMLIYSTLTMEGDTNIGSIGLLALSGAYGKIKVSGLLKGNVFLDLMGDNVYTPPTGLESFIDWSNKIGQPILSKADGWDDLQVNRFNLRNLRKYRSNILQPIGTGYIIAADGKLSIAE